MMKLLIMTIFCMVGGQLMMQVQSKSVLDKSKWHLMF